MAASPSRTPFHLAALRIAGLLSAERDARQITYRVDFAAMGSLVRYLLEDCCAGNGQVRACCT